MIGAHGRGSYWDNVTVNRYNGHIEGTNMNVRCLDSAMLGYFLMDADADVCQTEQPQISYSIDFIAEQSSAMGSPNLLAIGSGGRLVSRMVQALYTVY